MKIKDIMLVRATNKTIPFNGEILPTSMSMALRKAGICDYMDIMRKIFTEHQANKGITYKVFTSDEDRARYEKDIEPYVPYEGQYTSTISFSFNGLVPDDMNNRFSNYGVAVLDPLESHLDADFVNLHVVDTTIKGSIKVSDKAILVINQDLYNSLTEAEKNNLNENYTIEIFNGDLNTAVDRVLKKYGYPSLELLQSRQDGYMEDCDEKESVLNIQEELGKKLGVTTLRLGDLYFHDISSFSGVDRDSKEKIQDESKNIRLVSEYYKKMLYDFLVEKASSYGISLTDEEQYYLYSNYRDSKIVLEKLIKALINAVGGLEEFAKIILEYNNMVKEYHITGEEIVNMSSGGMSQY